MDRNNKMPLYRFKGYIDCWEQRKLGEVYSFSQGQQVPVEEQFEQINENRIRFIRIVDLTNKGEEKRYIEFKSSTGRVYEKDIFFVRYGAVGVVGIGYDGIIANNLFKLNPLMNVNNKFMYVQFNREKFKKTLQGFSASTTMPAISFTDIRTINIYLPPLPEQTAIGNFFQTLDRSIALHQRKLDSLKEQKKTYLQKLFPRNGETIPEIRFPEFQNAPAWEQRKLGEVSEISKGVQRGKQEIQEMKSHNDQYPVFNGGQSESGYTNEYNRENKVMISEGGASAGYVNYYSGKYWSGGHNFTVDNLGNDIYFIYSILQSSQQKLYSLKVGSGLPNIQLNTIRNHDILIPTLAEQTAIGNFFQTLDRSITLHQRKLDKLKESKQTLLKKMLI